MSQIFVKQIIVCTAALFVLYSCEPDDPVVPTVTTADVSSITKITAESGGTVIADGGASVTARGVCWSTSQNPTINLSTKTNNGSGIGAFTSNITGLTANTTYYFRAYATNSAGTSYGEPRSFTTSEVIPSISTSDISSITSTTAESGGTITSDGGASVTARGVCWSTTENPTIDLTTKTSDWVGTGAFTSAIAGLNHSTTYYVRAYATNSVGTSYGEQKTLTTHAAITVNGVRFEMVQVEGGTFTMGGTSEQGADAFYDELPTHQVTLSTYYIGKYEVTQELWLAVMGSWPGTLPDSDKGLGANYPAYFISWDDCQSFITNLNQMTGLNFSLPTEAQWEYAARGGNKSQGYKYSGSNTLDDVAWYWNNSNLSSHEVGTKAANELGIYDMSGNVCEWCSDWYGDYSSDSQTNPTGPSSGSLRVLRGGSWFSSAEFCRVSFRNNGAPDCRYYFDSGFRLALLP